MVDMISIRAIKLRPKAPYASNSVNQYSPAPVVKTTPIRKQIRQAIPEKKCKKSEKKIDKTDIDFTKIVHYENHNILDISQFFCHLDLT